MHQTLGELWRRIPVSLRRRFVHMLVPTFTVGVSGVVLNGEGDVLLLRHRFRESRHWELPGGFIARGESPADALVRELLEETGLEIEVLRIAAVSVRADQHLDVCFLARIRDGSLHPSHVEVETARFFPTDELPPELSPEQQSNIEAGLREAST